MPRKRLKNTSYLVLSRPQFGHVQVREPEAEYNPDTDGRNNGFHESSTLEFKRELPRKEALLATLCALANTAGGEIHIGVDDSGQPVGLVESTLLDSEERISSWIVDGIKPMLVPFISIRMTPKGPILVIQVGGGSGRPYSCIGTDGGTTYVRIGSTTRKADTATLHRLRLQAMGRTWDSMPAHGVSEKDLDAGLIKEYLQARSTRRKLPPPKGSTREWLLKNRFLTNENGRVQPTHAGVLFFHPCPQEILPQSQVELARFAKTDTRDFLDKQSLVGPLWKLPDLALDFLKKHLPTRAIRGGLPGRLSMQRAEFLAYPHEAFREFFINAICHRSYEDPGTVVHVALFDDLLELTNPGSLMEGFEVQDLGSGLSSLRNSVIARGFNEIHLIEGWGTGIREAQKSLHAVGLPSATFRLKGFFFQVSSLWRWSADLSENDVAILNLITSAGSISSAEAAEKLGWSPRTTRRTLGILVEKGLLAKSGTTKASLYRLR